MKLKLRYQTSFSLCLQDLGALTKHSRLHRPLESPIFYRPTRYTSAVHQDVDLTAWRAHCQICLYFFGNLNWYQRLASIFLEFLGSRSNLDSPLPYVKLQHYDQNRRHFYHRLLESWGLSSQWLAFLSGLDSFDDFIQLKHLLISCSCFESLLSRLALIDSLSWANSAMLSYDSQTGSSLVYFYFRRALWG